MRLRWMICAMMAVALVVLPSLAAPSEAQGSRKVFQVSLVSFKFTPSLITVNQGDIVVLELSNEDPDRRNHSLAARWLVGKDVTVRGTLAREGIDDERRFFAVAPGQKAEIEFVMSERGSFPFVCGVFDHGARGQTGAINVIAP